jgi:hypothetical protein
MEFSERRLCALEGVIQDRRNEDFRVLNTALLCQHSSASEWMVDVWRALMVLSLLMAMVDSDERSDS